MLGHVNFTARPVVVVLAGHEAPPPRPFFAEVRHESTYLMASCVMSLDDDGEEELEEEDLSPLFSLLYMICFLPARFYISAVSVCCSALDRTEYLSNC